MLGFVDDVSADEFQVSLLVQSAVERQLEILGEALNRLRRSDPMIAAKILDVDRLIGMRNILAHEYGAVDPVIVWSVVELRLPPLVDRLTTLLGAG